MTDDCLPSSLVSGSDSANTNCRRLLPRVLRRPAHNNSMPSQLPAALEHELG